MNLWLSSYFLVAGLFLSSSALTPEECQPLVKPLLLTEPSMVFKDVRTCHLSSPAAKVTGFVSAAPNAGSDVSIIYGWWTTVAGYVDGEGFDALQNATESTWMNVTQSPSSPNVVVLSEKNKINGTCVDLALNLTIDGNTASGSVGDMVFSKFQFLPSCDGCFILSVNTTARNLDKLLQQLNINMDVTGEEVNIRAIYLIGRESTVKDSELEHFKQQASCLGFSREPDFIYDPKNGFCA